MSLNQAHKKLAEAFQSGQLLKGTELERRHSENQKRYDSRFRSVELTQTHWNLPLLRGRVVEVCAENEATGLSMVVQLMKEAQQENEFIAWVTHHPTYIHPQDLLAYGLDIRSFVIIRDTNGENLYKSIEILLSSKAFGIIIVEFPEHYFLKLTNQQQLLKRCRESHTLLIHMQGTPYQIKEARNTSKNAIFGSIVDFRVKARLKHNAFNQFSCELRTVKNRLGSTHWSLWEDFHGITGLR